MTSDITRGEFSHLEARVAIVEREIEGEKMVTRHILEQTRLNGDDLAAMKVLLDRVELRFDRVESRLDQVESRLDRLEQKLDRLDQKFNGFVRDFPATIGQIMRGVLREREKI
jgi:chromosome segregation ATPase